MESNLDQKDEYATFESTTGLVQKKPIPSSLKAKAVVLGFLLLAIGAFVGQKASQALAEPLELTDVAAEGVQAWDPANCPGDSPNPLTCWADEAYQKCGPTGDERQGAYDAVMAKAPDQAAMFAEHNSCGVPQASELLFGLTTNPNSAGCKLIVTVDSQATEFTFQGASQVEKSVSLTDWPTTVKFEMDPDGSTHYDNCRIVAPILKSIGGTNTFDFVAQFDSAAVTTQKEGNVKQGAADGSVFRLEAGTIISTHPPWMGDTRGGTVSGSWHVGASATSASATS